MAQTRVPSSGAMALRVMVLLGRCVAGARRATPRRDAALAALQASESRFRSLVENSSGVILLLASDGTVGFASPTLTRVLGHLPEAVVGRPVAELWTRPTRRHSSGRSPPGAWHRVPVPPCR